MNEERPTAAETREKRDIIGEWPWQVRSSVVVHCGLGGLYLMLTNQVAPKNWFEKFFIFPSVVLITAVHAYWLLYWIFDFARGNREPTDNAKPELD